MIPSEDTTSMLDRIGYLSEVAAEENDMDLAQACISGVAVLAALELCYELPSYEQA